MTTKRLREIAANCEDVSFIASESNAAELRAFANELDKNPIHTNWVWNRQIIEKIRAVVPHPPVLDEDLVDAVAALITALKDARCLLCSEGDPDEDGAMIERIDALLPKAKVSEP